MVVTRQELERFLAELERDCDPEAGLFGPGSEMWRVSRESILFLGGGRAALLQLAHPWVATAVAHHSTGPTDLPGRFRRTFERVFAMTFGDLASAMDAARRVHALHDTVTGRLDEAVGPFREGTRYAANDEEALLWVHATLADTSVMMFEMFVSPMSAAQKEALWQESRRFAKLFGIPERALPATWLDFRNYFDRMIEGQILSVGQRSREMARFLLTPPNRVVTPAWRIYAAITAQFMPERLRAPLGLSWTAADRALARAALATLGMAWRRLPERLRLLPAYVDARRRLSGEPSRDPVGIVAERIVLAALSKGGAAPLTR